MTCVFTRENSGRLEGSGFIGCLPEWERNCLAAQLSVLHDFWVFEPSQKCLLLSLRFFFLVEKAHTRGDVVYFLRSD